MLCPAYLTRRSRRAKTWLSVDNPVENCERLGMPSLHALQARPCAHHGIPLDVIAQPTRRTRASRSRPGSAVAVPLPVVPPFIRGHARLSGVCPAAPAARCRARLGTLVRLGHFRRRRVRRRKFISARKRANCTPQADNECAAASRSPFKRKPKAESE